MPSLTHISLVEYWLQLVHHFFKMNIDAKTQTGTLEYNLVQNTDLIVIIQFSLLEMRPFLNMDKILRDMAPNEHQGYMAFRGNHILMGDPAQLSAIEEDIFHTFFWKQNFTCVMLTNVNHQKDKTFQCILLTFCLGHVTNDINSILRSMLLPDDNVDVANMDLNNGAIICSLCKERNAWNKKFLHRLNAPEQYSIVLQLINSYLNR